MRTRRRMSRASNDRIAEHAFRPSLSRASRKTNDQPVSSAGTVLPHIFSQFCLTRGQSPGAAHSGGTPVWLSIRHCDWCSDRRRRRKFNRSFPGSVAMTSDTVAQALVQLCRCITRPALANEQVQRSAAGRVVTKLKTPMARLHHAPGDVATCVQAAAH